MVIIQTKALKDARRSLLEQFLSNFMPEVQQFLEVNPRDFDRKFVSLLKRLEAATMKKEIIELMQRENLLQEEWDDMVRSKEEERKQKEEAQRLLRLSVLSLLELGLTMELIANKLNLSVSQVEEFTCT